MERIRLTGEHPQNLPVRGRPDRTGDDGTRVSFQETLRSARAGQWNQRMDLALARLDQLGERLARTFSLEDLKRYRTAVAELMHDLSRQMVQVRADVEWDTQSWEQRTLVTIRRVNEEVEKLAQMVLSKEQDRLAILAKIGEIKGLLLDVRM